MGLEKINELKKELHLTTEELSKLSGVPLGTLNKILSGATKDPKLQTLKALARVLNCTLDDFDDNDHPTRISVQERKLINKYRKIDLYGKKSIDDLVNNEFERCIQPPADENISDLPLFLLPTSAGTGVFLDSDDYDIVQFNNVPHGANFAVKVKGDSMEPSFCDDDIVFVKQQQDLEDGEIGIFQYGGEGYIKKLDKINHSLISLNPAYKPIVINNDRFRIIGKVLGVYHG